MDFQCDRCGQKYHVADEKLQGRAASRFKCKKCENMILLPGPSAPQSSMAPPVDAAPIATPVTSPLRAPTVGGPVGARPATGAIPRAGVPGVGAPGVGVPRARAATTTGPAYGAAAAPRPAPAIDTASNAPEADEHGWFAGIRDVPVGPISRAEVQRHIHAGDVTGDTLVWRDGFGDWRPLRTVPALKDLLPPLRVVAPRQSHPPLANFSDSDGDATVVSDQSSSLVAAALAASAAVPDQRLQEAPTRKLSALTDDQLRGLRLPPVAIPEKPAAPVAKPLAPAAKPSTPTPVAKPLAPAPRPPTPATTPTPAPRVPVTGRSPTLAPTRKPEAPVAPPVPSPSIRPPTPAVEAPAPDLFAAKEPSVPSAKIPSVPPARVPSVPPPSSATTSAPPSPAVAEAAPPPAPAADFAPVLEAATTPAAPAVGAWEDPVFKASVPPSAAPAARGGAWSDPVFDTHPPAAPSAASAVVSTKPAAVPSVPAEMPAALTNTGPLGVAVDVAPTSARPRSRGLLVAAAGLVLVAVVGGVIATRRPAPEAPRAVQAPTPPPAPPSVAQPTAPAPAVAAPTPTPAPQETAPDMAFAPDNNGGAAAHNRPRPHTPRPGAPEPALSNDQRQAAIERMMGLSPGAAHGPAPTIVNAPLRQPAATATAQNNSATAPASTGTGGTGSTRIRDTVREREAVDQVERSGIVRRCWEQFKLRNPAAAARRLNMTVNVAESGQISLRLDDRSEPVLTTCLETRSASQIRALAAGTAVHTSFAVTLN